MVCLRAVQKALTSQREVLGKLSDENLYSMRYILHRAETVALEDAALGTVEDARA